MHDPHVITKDELIEMLKPFDGHEKICIKIDPKSIPDESVFEASKVDADETDKDEKPKAIDCVTVESIGELQFAIDKATFLNEQMGARLVLEAFAL